VIRFYVGVCARWLVLLTCNLVSTQEYILCSRHFRYWHKKANNFAPLAPTILIKISHSIWSSIIKLCYKREIRRSSLTMEIFSQYLHDVWRPHFTSFRTACTFLSEEQLWRCARRYNRYSHVMDADSEANFLRIPWVGPTIATAFWDAWDFVEWKDSRAVEQK
jgi:hypothetical protein